MTINRFILIDDDNISNSLSKLSINKTIADIDVRIFTMPEKALEFIESEFTGEHDNISSIILLEINTASMSGWNFLDAFSALPEKLKERFIIYILSASIDERDKERARIHPLITDYIEKPLTIETVRRIFFFNNDLIKGKAHISSGADGGNH